MAYPCRPFLQPSKVRPVSHPELGRHAGRFPLLSETLNISETMCQIFAAGGLPPFHSMPLQQSLPRRVSTLPTAENTCRHTVVGSVFDHLLIGRMFEEDCRWRDAFQWWGTPHPFCTISN